MFMRMLYGKLQSVCVNGNDIDTAGFCELAKQPLFWVRA